MSQNVLAKKLILRQAPISNPLNSQPAHIFHHYFIIFLKITPIFALTINLNLDMEKKAPYKFVYLGHYAINMLVIIALLIIYWSGADMPETQDFLQMIAWCTGLLMVLYLFGRTFVVNDAYKGKRCLDRRTTILLTLLLGIVNVLLVYYYLGHELFIKPVTFWVVVWLGTFIYVTCRGKLIKSRENTTAA